jgi:pimeloyl-ACP methyl ester carboxylesterase
MWRSLPLLSLAEIAEVHAPTLVIVGSQDDIELQHSRSMVQAIAGAELAVIPGAGHAVPRDAPEAVARHIKRFLAEDRVPVTQQ